MSHYVYANIPKFEKNLKYAMLQVPGIIIKEYEACTVFSIHWKECITLEIITIIEECIQNYLFTIYGF
jgi:hypothetical protein